jgi:transcriptional regulator with XRE-family HTH domain
MSTRATAGFYARLGQQIRTLRLEAGLSQRALGARLGRSASAIDRYEMGQRRIALAELVRMAEVLGVPAATFLGAGAGRRRPGSAQPASLRSPAEVRAEHLRLLRALDRRLSSSPAEGHADAVAEEPAGYAGPVPSGTRIAPQAVAASLSGARLRAWARQAGLPSAVGVEVLRRFAVLVMAGTARRPDLGGR